MRYGHSSTNASKNAGHLKSYVAASNNHDGRRTFFQRENIIGSQAMLRARNFRNVRSATRCDQDMAGTDQFVADPDLPRTFQACVSLKDLHAGLLQQVFINAIETRDLAVLVAFENFPVERRLLLPAPPIGTTVDEGLVGIRGIGVQFLWNTAYVDTSTTKKSCFGYS